MRAELTDKQLQMREKCIKEGGNFFKKKWSQPCFDDEMFAFRQEYAMHIAIHQAKAASGLTQGEIAKRMGIPYSNVSRLEHSKSVSFDSFCAYLNACGFAFNVNLFPINTPNGD